MSRNVSNRPAPQRDQRDRIADSIMSIDLLNDTDRAALSANGIKSLDDLADLASDELREIVGSANMTRGTADQVILAARAHWFEASDDEAPSLFAGQKI